MANPPLISGPLPLAFRSATPPLPPQLIPPTNLQWNQPPSRQPPPRQLPPQQPPQPRVPPPRQPSPAGLPPAPPRPLLTNPTMPNYPPAGTNQPPAFGFQ